MAGSTFDVLEGDSLELANQVPVLSDASLPFATTGLLVESNGTKRPGLNPSEFEGPNIFPVAIWRRQVFYTNSVKLDTIIINDFVSLNDLK